MKYTQPCDDHYYAQYIPSCGSLQKSESHTVYEVQPMTAGERLWRYVRQKAFNFGLFLLAVVAVGLLLWLGGAR